MIRHANRTTGFFKVRGVNVNHAEFEDMMFRNADVLDFQAVLETEPKTDLENLRVLIEIKGEASRRLFAQQLRRPSKRLSRFRLCCKCSSAAVLRRNSNAA